ncbi:putative mitochondrial protein [Glycine soja]
MQSYPPRALHRRLQEDWAKDAREGPRVLMSLRWHLLSLFLSPFHCHSSSKKQRNIDEEDPRPTSSNGAYTMWYQEHLHLGTNMSLHSSSSINGEGSTPKDPLYEMLDELRSLKLWKEKQERKDKSQDEREKIRKEERRKILKELRKEKHASYSSHNSCKSLSEELRDYYEGRHRSHLRPHSHRREKERKSQEANINLSYFHGKDNVEANLDWEIRKDQGQGILGVTPSKPKDDKGKTIEKQPLKASMQEKTSSMKCFKCLGRGHITSQCPTKKTMIMRGQDIYSSQDEATTSPSSSESEEAKGEESSEEIYPQKEGRPLMVKEECKEVSVSSKRQPPHFLLCKKTLVSIATPLRLEFIPQVKELLDEDLVHKRLNPCALLVPKIGIIRHQIPMIGGMMNVLSGATLFCKITHAPNIFMIFGHRDSLGRFVLIFYFNANLGSHVGHLRNNQHENKEKGMFYSITFPNFLNSDQGLPMDPKRTKVIPEWPTPPSIREIWGFNILTNFYKRFVPYFSILVTPLSELVRIYILSWEDGQERGFPSLPYSNIPNITNTCVEERIHEFQEPLDLRSNPFQGGGNMVLAPLELVGLGSSSSTDFFASWKMNGNRMEKGRERERRRHFKEKMSLEEAHHHRRSWIRAWRKKEMNEGRGREEHKILCSI